MGRRTYRHNVMTQYHIQHFLCNLTNTFLRLALRRRHSDEINWCNLISWWLCREISCLDTCNTWNMVQYCNIAILCMLLAEDLMFEGMLKKAFILDVCKGRSLRISPGPRTIWPDPAQVRSLPSIRYTYVSRVAQAVVSGYGLDDRAIEVRSPAESKGFFF
jgi:hypothetical protein